MTWEACEGSAFCGLDRIFGQGGGMEGVGWLSGTLLTPYESTMAPRGGGRSAWYLLFDSWAMLSQLV